MDYLLKCRALYLRSIALTLDINLVITDAFIELLNSFLNNYYEQYFDLFDLIYKLKTDEEEEYNSEKCDELLKKYLYDFTVNDIAIKLYDDIGTENVNKISELSYKFCEYYYEIIDINNNKLIRS
ncbi:MAG: hypothetical protein IJZ79_04315 [Bacilli bacterium]|nr:hypothetical protein [Bacilli bacterium]